MYSIPLVRASLFVIVAASFVVVRYKKKSRIDDYESTPSVMGIEHIDELDTKGQEIVDKGVRQQNTVFELLGWQTVPRPTLQFSYRRTGQKPHV